MKKSTTQQKVNFLLANQHLWEGYDGRYDNSFGLRVFVSPRYARTVKAMQEAGLWSKRNGGRCHNLGRLIDEARKQRRMKTICKHQPRLANNY